MSAEDKSALSTKDERVNKRQKTEAEEDRQGEREPRIPKRKVALLFGYLGTQFQGLQKNPGANSVELVLEKALYDAGGISDSNFGDLKKIGWARAARTDKGVHAVAQTVSFKLQTTDIATSLTRLRAALPPTIRAFAFKLVANKFNVKLQATGRRYQYLLPSLAISLFANSFASSLSSGLSEAQMDALSEEEKAKEGVWLSPHDVPTSVRDEYSKQLFSHRLAPDDPLVGRFSALFGNYEGTHNFHNYTSHRGATDASSKRYITSFKVGALEEHDGVQYVRLTVCGQSFMLNQIRKMIGMAILVHRHAVDHSSFETAWAPQKIMLPMAPGLGLYLDQIFFNNYNKKVQNEGGKCQLDFVEDQPQFEAFKNELLFPEITRVEREQHVMATWLAHLDSCRQRYLREGMPIAAEMEADGDAEEEGDD